MISDAKSYGLFFKFIEAYSHCGYNQINRNDALVLELEELMGNNKQFFFVGDIVKMKIHFTSNRSFQMTGILPDDLTPYHFREGVHPDDALRQGLGTTQLFKIANELYIGKKGQELLSINLRIRNCTGDYSNLLIQCYLFYSDSPIKTVYIVQIHTEIESFKKNKNLHHYYVGNNLSNLRYPDEELLQIGNPLSDREFEIVKLIADALSSEQIAEKIFLSVHTISTHRSNILERTGYNTIADLIFDFHKRGLM